MSKNNSGGNGVNDMNDVNGINGIKRDRDGNSAGGNDASSNGANGNGGVDSTNKNEKNMKHEKGKHSAGRPGPGKHGAGRPGPGGHSPGGGPPMMRPAEKAKDFKGSFKRLVGYLKPHRLNLIIVLIFAVLSTSFSIAAPKISSRATNKLQDGYMAKMMLKNMAEVQDKVTDSIKAAMEAAQKGGAGAQAGGQGTSTPGAAGGQGNTAGVQGGAPGTQGITMPGMQGLVMNSESIAAIQDFMKLPRLSELTDANQKADVCAAIINFLKKMQELQASTAGNAGEASQGAQNGNAQNDGAQNGDTQNGVAQNSDSQNSDSQNGGIQGETGMHQFAGAGGQLKLTDEQIQGALEAIRETNGEYDFKYIGNIVLIMIGIFLLSSGFNLVMGLVMSGVSQKTVCDLRKEVDMKLNRLPLKYFDMHPHGDILSRVTNDIDTIAGTLQQSLTQVITSVISILGYIIMMLTISPVLTLIVIATLPLYAVATMLIAKKSQKFFAAQQKELGDLSGHVEEMYTGHKIVKAFGQEKNSINKFEEMNDRLYDAGWKAQFVSGVMFPLMNFISNLGYVLISIVGGIWITKDLLKLGDILAFIQYSRSFTMPIVQTANIANIIQSTVACAERVFEVLDEKEEIPDSENARVLKLPRGEVEFEHVRFSYKEDEPLIEDLSLKVRPGDTIAIVGPTGAGKTTLVNLLMRFYEIQSGRISIDGVDIRDFKRSDLRRMFGMVLQDTWLFNGTIRDNIAYGRENATMDEIVRAAKAAHADHFIRTLPEGYNTVLNEEATNISQGQKQLLTIARAILADPAILILDEATSSVDTRTEVLIQKAMVNLMKGRTSFVIAHRLSTIRDAEMILVMNHGSIIEMGNHKDLLAKGGFYADLYNSQFSGANLDNEAV